MNENKRKHSYDIWKSILGEHSVIAAGNIIEQYQSNITEYHSRHIPIILRPTSSEQLLDIVKVANQYRTPLYPISTGKNWGLGSRLPVISECTIVDLSQLNSIIAVNERFRYAIIEPGVTQKQLSDHLRAIGSSLILNVTGSGEDTSVIGNVLERGVGALDHRIRDLLGMEVILGNGNIVRTGYWHFYNESNDNSHVAYYPYGIGPDLNGLFTQSNLGIVTKIIIRLVKYQSRTGAYFFFPEKHLASVIDTLHSLREEQVIVGSHIVTEVKDPRTVETVTVDFSQPTPLWFSSMMMSRCNAMRSVAMKEVENQLCKFTTQLHFFDTTDPDQIFKNDYVRIMAQMMHGIPTNYSLETMAKMTRHSLTKLNIDLDPQMPGFVCALLAIPFAGEQIVEIISQVRTISRMVDIDSYFNFVAIGDTAMEGFFRVFFDRSDEGQIAKAHRWNEQVYQKLETIGIYPYRVNIEHMHHFVERRQDTFWQLVRDIKGTLDPNDIIAPGRYAPL
ncbi:MAG: FAD-binding oxidoreductase [Caldilineaceae bacterium]